MKLKMISLAAAAAAAFSTAPALAASFTIDFEQNWEYGAAVDSTYASQGVFVSFSNVFGLSNGDGLGPLVDGSYYANAPSPMGVAYVYIDNLDSNQAFMNVAGGGMEGGLSFFYSSPSAATGAIKAFSGLNGTGSFLGSFDFAATDSDYSTWQQGTFMFSGVAQSFDLTVAQGAALDNISAVPEPESFALLLAGMGLVGAAVRRQRKQSV